MCTNLFLILHFKDFLLIELCVIAVPPVGPEPVPLICPACKESVYTSVKKASSPLSYICCILMCSVGYVKNKNKINNYFFC